MLVGFRIFRGGKSDISDTPRPDTSGFIIRIDEHKNVCVT